MTPIISHDNPINKKTAKMDLFLSQFLNNIDKKGRVTLPQLFALNSEAFCTQLRIDPECKKQVLSAKSDGPNVINCKKSNEISTFYIKLFEVK